MDDGVNPLRLRLLRQGWVAAMHRDVCQACGKQFGQGVMIHPEPEGFRAECCAPPPDFWEHGSVG